MFVGGLLLTMPAQALKLIADPLEFLIGHVLKIDHLVASSFNGVNQLIQLQMEGLGIAVLCVLDQEHHQKRNDRGAGIDNQLPRIRVMENGTGHAPGDNGADGDKE